jgi:hypothetical protein
MTRDPNHPDAIRERIERYRTLLEFNPDLRARRVLEVLIREAERQLAVDPDRAD